MSTTEHVGFARHKSGAQIVVLRREDGACVLALPGGEKRVVDRKRMRKDGWLFSPCDMPAPAQAQEAKGWWLGKSASFFRVVQPEDAL